MDTKTFEWTKLEPTGEAPDARGGHSACVLPNSQLLIYGGWSNHNQFSNMFIYDIKGNKWIDAEISHEIPRWNFNSVMVKAIPSWKFFVFGGSVGSFVEGHARNLGRFSDDLFFFDVDHKKWQPVPLVDGTKPKSRESGALFYDSSDSKLVLFGGWNNDWLGDIYAIPVGMITGPPYAIFDLRPKLGPYTGNTKLTITGVGFTNTSNIIVRFTIGKVTVDCEGVYVSDTELTCKTPDFSHIGPKEVDVTLAIDRGDFTITSAKFNFFLNTKADKTIAYGPGLLCENPADAKTVFYIQARNEKGENRVSGADEFVVELKRYGPDGELIEDRPPVPVAVPSEKKEGEEEEAKEDGEGEKPASQGEVAKEEKAEAPQESERPSTASTACTVEDLGDGSYKVTYQAKIEGEVDVSVRYRNEKGELENIRGSPFLKVKLTKKAPVKNTDIAGPGISSYITHTLNDIEKFINETKNVINIKNKNINEDVYSLLKVKEGLNSVTERKDETILALDTLEELLRSLEEKHEVHRDSDLKKTLKLIEEWKNLEKLANNVEKEIAGPLKNEGEKCKEQLVKFEEELKQYDQGIRKESFYIYKTGIDGAFKRLDEVKVQIEDFDKKVENFVYYTEMFGFPERIEQVNKNLDKVKTEVNAVRNLWAQIKKSEAKFNEYLERKWGEIVPSDMEEEIKKLRKEVTDLRGLDKKSLAYLGIVEDMKKWATFIPLLSELKDPSMDVPDQRHWKEVQTVTGKTFTVDEVTPLQIIWDLKLFEFKDPIEEITDKAKQEAKMEKILNKIDEKWKEVAFEKQQHKDTNIMLLKMSDENFEALEENHVQIQNMSASKYLAYFENIVNKWRASLTAIFDVVQLLSEVQKTWSFLENLFIHSEEVMKELPQESEKFRGIDKKVKEIIEDGNKIMNILQFCTQEHVFKDLDVVLKELKFCEKALNKFLDDKRKAFPRFYFVSVNDLLDILSNGNNPYKINKHMSKIFQSIDKLDLKHQEGQRPQAVGFHSSVGVEYVPFSIPLALEGKVEVYLQKTVEKMVSTLNEVALNSIKSYNTMSRDEWINKDAAQITILINMIQWVSNVENALTKIQNGDLNAMKNLYKESVEGLTALIKKVQGDLTPPIRQKVMVLITMDTHSRDIVDRLVQEDVRQVNAFQWQSQLKFYWDTSAKDCKIAITDAVLWYGYEYLGNGPRLVITPLTDRIYVTATQALHLKMGCAPAGPAGTGKTETTKDLASAVGKACYVFNCSGEMTYESMGNIFKGLAASGCWGCFDEFNRLIPEVLSVCSVQFKAVTDAIKAKRQRFVLQGDEINLDPTCGAFITMNPGYLGRSELPEGLKALFRPITVVVPDLELICENLLMAEGFVEAKVLATKFTTLYALCRDLLSKQDHYDWGLRAIKSVLVVAGAFKRAEPEIREQALLMRALRDFNIPKIVAADLDVFFGLLGDLFPGIDIPRKTDPNFEGIVEAVCIENRLFPDPDFKLKVVQLKELMEIRHCVFVMGPPGAGKSSTWKVLAKSQDKAGQKTTFVDLDPKVVSTRDLYGYVMVTKEWKDGLLSKVMRSLGEITDTNPKWIVLDGDLDANWIESMNSVMDDNKILTLASNERIPLKPHMRMLFEIRDLKFATPATVSRAGILYISDDKGTQWKSYVRSWVQTLPDRDLSANIQKLFDKYVDIAISFLFRSCKFLIPMSKMALVISICKALEPLLDASLRERLLHQEFLFVWAVVWAIGACLSEKDGIDFRKVFSDFWRSQGDWKIVKFPSKGTIFDFFVDQTGDSPKLEEWGKKVPAIEYDDITPMQNITVPTPETVSTSEFLRNYIIVGQACLLIGMAGSGKTQLMKGLLKDIVTQKPDSFMYQIINFNYYTESDYLINMLEQTLEKKGGRQKGPRGKAKLIYFVDDLNMCMLDPYNTQTAIALLRQHADYGHWYDVSKLQLVEIVNTQTVAAMNPTAGSFFVNPRYQRHFWTCAVPFPDQTSLFTIYNTFMVGHFKKFKSTVQEQIQFIIKATLALHQSVIASFRKTAINFHYEFNIRHLAGVFQGLLLAQPNQFQDPEKLVRLWIHESERIYGDRLVSPEHLLTFKAQIADLVKKNFSKFNLNRFFSGATPEAIIFCDFTQGINNDRFYDQMPNDKLESHVGEALKEYNDNNAVMDLVLFDDAIKHICKITRIIRQPSGHALLVGVGGSGKQSLSRLAAFICGYTTFQIVISQSYSLNDLKTDLQGLYNKTGVKDEGILFLFTDGQITNERFLVYINDLLSSGEIADLYQPEEKDAIINSVRSKVKAEGKPDTPDNCWTYFIGKVKANLHMALCFSPVGEAFRRRARQFPALVNTTVIDWFQPWPQDALLNVAKQFLKEIDLGEEEVRGAVERFMPYSFKAVNQASSLIYEQERRYIYTTPKSFLELIKLFKTMLTTKRTNLERSKERYETGLIKLRETASVVSELEESLKVKQVTVDAAKAEADAVATTVGAAKEKVEKETAIANEKAAKATEIQRVVEEQKASAQKDLDAALPLVEKAQSALKDISEKDFQMAKSFANPPKGVPEVFGTCIYLMAGLVPNEMVEVDKNKKPKAADWKACQKMMKDPKDFKNKLIDCKAWIDEGKVPTQNINPIRPFLQEPWFTVEEIKSKSTAAAGICAFIQNIVLYFDVVQEVEPKRKALKEATEQFEAANAQVAEAKATVAKLQEELDKLQAEYDEALAKKNAVEAEANLLQRKLGLAKRLINALGSEDARWANSIVELDKALGVIVGDVLISSAFVSYAGPFTKKFREMIIKGNFLKYMKDAKIPMAQNPDPLVILVDDATKAAWNNQGLPSDQVSIENGTILTNSERYTLMIDPQLQGITWIREKEKKNNLQVTRLGNKDIMNKLELAIESGWSVLIENMDEQVDATLNPIIARNFFKRGKNKILKLGGKDLTLNEKFRLFMHTKLANPHYPPEIQAEATLINFTVTEDGLGDQLLTLVVGKERPDLAKKKIELIQQQNEFKIKLKELEDDLLSRLANAQGDILADVELIENLETSKRIAVEVQEKVIVAKATEININEASEKYRSVADRGALIFFLMNELAKIHSFYMYSLESFVVVVNRAIDSLSEGLAKPKKVEAEEAAAEGEAVAGPGKKEEGVAEGGEGPAEGEAGEKAAEEKGEEENGQDAQDAQEALEAEEAALLTPRSLDKRVHKLIDVITLFSFNYIRKGLFERHKLIVAALLTFRILIRSGKLAQNEVNHLIVPQPPLQRSPIPDNFKSFLTEGIWEAVISLEGNIKTHFEGLQASLEADLIQWKKWYGEEKAELAPLPKDFRDLGSFPKLLLLRAMRPDRLPSALTNFVSETMGEVYVQQAPFNIFETYKETNSSTPIFFVLFPGVDPTPDVERVGATLDISSSNGKFENISMGQGQEDRARDAIFRAAKEGTWIMLQNVHLMQSWMKLFEGYLEKASATADPNFRCFISSEPPPIPTWKIIPESILQNSIKVANEAPQDLKANLRRAYAKFSQEKIAASTKANEYKAILFALCMFHSLMLGRKKFGSQGWSRVYNFNDGDLTICADVLHNYLEKYEKVPYDDLRYIYGEIMYGGHITDNWDRRTCNTYLLVLIKPELLSKDFNLAPGFKSPDAGKFDYEAYRNYIEERLPIESPQMFGMHPNAEIGYLTATSEMIFDTIIEVQGGGAAGGSKKEDDGVVGRLTDFKQRIAGRSFNLLDVRGKMKEMIPYNVVLLQECERMNELLEEIDKSLEELKLGLEVTKEIVLYI